MIISNKLSIFRNILIVSVSFLMAFFPWDYVGRTFRDTERYIERIIYLSNFGTEREYHGLGYLFSEPLWKLYLKFSANYFIDYYNAIHLLSFLSLIVFIDFMYKKSLFTVATLFLLNSMFVTLILDQTRMAVALALFLIAYQLKNKYVILMILFLAWMIHWFSIIFVFIYILFYILEKYIKGRLFFILVLLASFIIAMSLPFFVDQVLSSIGGTRRSYTQNMGSSMLYSLPWFLLSLALILFTKPLNAKIDRIIMAYSIYMLSFYFFLSSVGMYGSRFFVATIPFVVISLSKLYDGYRKIILFFLFLYDILLWISWIGM
jgi:hypothetical protein